jgi:hypothetical protein
MPSLDTGNPKCGESGSIMLDCLDAVLRLVTTGEFDNICSDGESMASLPKNFAVPGASEELVGGDA